MSFIDAKKLRCNEAMILSKNNFQKIQNGILF